MIVTKPSADMPFPASAHAGLQPVAGGIEDAKRGAEQGQLYIDEEAGRALLAELTDVKSRVDDLIGQCAALDQPLKFGDNWVGQALNERLRSAAQGDPRAFIPVLEEFEAVLTDLQRTVKYAAGLYTDIDEDAAQKIRSSLGTFDIRMGDGNGAVR